MDPITIKALTDVGGLGLAFLLLLGKQFVTRVLDESSAREERLMGFVSEWVSSLSDIRRSLQAQVERLDAQGAMLCEVQKSIAAMKR